MAQKVLFIVLGLVLIIGGAYCTMTPGLTYAVVAPLAGIGMICDGISHIIAWNDMRKLGKGAGLLLVGAVVSLLLGIGLLASFGMQLAYDLLICYMVAFWLLASGIIRAVQGWKMNKDILMIVVGVLIALCGIGGFFNPISIALALGLMIGISIMMSGIGVLSFAFMSKK